MAENPFPHETGSASTSETLSRMLKEAAAQLLQTEVSRLQTDTAVTDALRVARAEELAKTLDKAGLPAAAAHLRAKIAAIAGNPPTPPQVAQPRKPVLPGTNSASTPGTATPTSSSVNGTAQQLTNGTTDPPRARRGRPPKNPLQLPPPQTPPQANGEQN